MSHEEELQHKIEQGETVQKTVDTYAYKTVFHALRQEPAFQLGDNFADKLVIELSPKPTKSYDHAWLAVGVAALMASAIITVVLIGLKPDVGAFTFLSRHFGLVLFGVFFVIGIHLLDKKIIGKRLKIG